MRTRARTITYLLLFRNKRPKNLPYYLEGELYGDYVISELYACKKNLMKHVWQQKSISNAYIRLLLIQYFISGKCLKFLFSAMVILFNVVS